MAKSKAKPERRPPPAVDAIRIVPLRLPAAKAAAAPAAHLSYRNGPLISAVEVFTFFWGSAWKQTAQTTLMTRINGFFDTILTSALIDRLAEYNVSKFRIGHGKHTGTTVLTTPTLGTSVTDTAIQTLLRQQTASGKGVPKPTANTLYFVYLPPGVRVVMGGSASCQAFCGYHNAVGTNLFYAVMPYPGCSGCTGGLSVFDALTSTSSHELCEAITDPIPGQGWYDDMQGEIGDICAWQTEKVGSFTVQKEWSNKVNSCV